MLFCTIFFDFVKSLNKFQSLMVSRSCIRWPTFDKDSVVWWESSLVAMLLIVVRLALLLSVPTFSGIQFLSSPSQMCGTDILCGASCNLVDILSRCVYCYCNTFMQQLDQCKLVKCSLLELKVLCTSTLDLQYSSLQFSMIEDGVAVFLKVLLPWRSTWSLAGRRYFLFLNAPYLIRYKPYKKSLKKATSYLMRIIRRLMHKVHSLFLRKMLTDLFLWSLV